jgi:hypothetical protein
VGPAAAYNTVGANNLSAANRVFVSWTLMPSATGYDVLHSQAPMFPANPGCVDCAVVKNTALNSVTDDNTVNLFWPDPGMAGSQAIAAVITIDNLTRAYPYYQSNINGAMAALALIYGVPVTNNCAKFDALGRIVDAGSVCSNGTAVWGLITGKIAAQGDLVAALAAKQADMGITGKVGNTNNFQAAGAGAPAPNDCAKYDANGNIVTAGGACAGGLPAQGGNQGKFLQTDSANPGWAFPILTDTYANIPVAAAGNTGQLFKPTNGLGIYRSTGAAWVGYGPLFPITPPPQAGWSWDNQRTATATFTGDFLSFTTDNAHGAENDVYYRAAPAAPYTLTTYCISNYPANVQTAGFLRHCDLFFRSSATGKLIEFGPYTNGGADCGITNSKWTNSTTFSADYTKNGPSAIYCSTATNRIWLRIEDDNANLKWWLSQDGVNWYLHDTRVRTDWMAAGPDQIGIGGRGTALITTTWLSWLTQ